MTTYPLGRLIQHDPRSRNYPARRVAPLKTTLWGFAAPVLDQGSLSSCTGNALAQCLNTARFASARPARRYLKEQAAVQLYSLGTELDGFPGQWPTNDTGSSGLGVCKAGVQLGYLSGYSWAFGWDHFAAAVMTSPVIVGVNWYQQMFDVDSAGFIRVGGRIAGGHEVCVLGINFKNCYVTIVNSWGPLWGVRGRARITFSDFQRLLAEDGDVTVPVP